MRAVWVVVTVVGALLIGVGCGSSGAPGSAPDPGAEPDGAEGAEIEVGAPGDVPADVPGPDAADAPGDAEADGPADAEADTPVTPSCGTERVQEDLAIPTIDGYALAAFLDRPAQPDCPLPTVLIQTPYDKEGARSSFFGEERASRPLFASPHYNFVVVDWRGRFGSQGLPHAGQGPWMAQDSYDTVEWIAAQPWSDGTVGLWGVSALCGAQYRTAVGPTPSAQTPDFADGPPPHLSAMVPIMCGLRTEFDSVYAGGVIRHEWATGLDVLGFGLRTIYEDNPRKNVLWNIVEAGLPADRIAVPALVVSGWWDLQPRKTVGAWKELRQASDPSVRDQHKLLIGPWIHFATGGAVGQGALRELTEEELAYMDFDRRIDADSLAFFDHHLRGIDNGVDDWAPITYHHDNQGWATAEQWPPAAAETRKLYLTAALELTETAPAEGEATFPYDPADPSPTIGIGTLSPYNCVGDPNPVLCSVTPNPDKILLHGPMSQAPLMDRDDHLVFTTGPLAEPLSLLGDIALHADVATTGGDADFALRVLHVDDTGDPKLIGEGIQRLSAREGETAFSEVTPGARYSLVVETFKGYAYTIPAGHQLSILVSGSHWPLFGRNPADGAIFYASDASPATKDTFSYGVPPTEVPMKMKGKGAPAEQTLFTDGSTWLELQVAK